MTTTYRTAGTTEDHTTCDHCGRENLKTTVRMVADDTELFMGVSCAANMTGKPARTIEREARDADKASKDAEFDAWLAAREAAEAPYRQWLLENRLEAWFQNKKAWRATL